MVIVYSVLLMAGLFLMLIAGVAFVQDKKYFTSAPKDIQEAILPRKERFPGAHAIGWCLMVLSLVIMIGALVLAGADGVKAELSFGAMFVRYLAMFWLLKLFDILFFDWFLLCHSGFYPHFFPETKELVGPHQFGFNKKSHVIQVLLCIPVSAVLAGICMLF
ncbi:MAG: hypothetical protein K6G23_04480 [Lachnospiraceae bacterium]|nr:hypothetical protein [Lachnospiraceae bacterium]